jgi:hypothetical protein
MINSTPELQRRESIREATFAVLGGAVKEIHENGIALVDYFGVRSNSQDFTLADLEFAVSFHLRRRIGTRPPSPGDTLTPDQQAAFEEVSKDLIEQGMLEPIFANYQDRRFRVRLVPQPFDQQWQFVKQLGGGGQSRTFQVLHKKHQTNGVLKLLAPTQSSSDRATAVERFRREVQGLNRINHLAVVKLVDQNIDEPRGELGYVTRLGIPLEIYWAERAKLFSPSELYDHAYRIIMRLADGLSEVHGHGFVHRDLKPDNVVLYGDEPVIIDFGLIANTKYQQADLTAVDGRQVGNHFNPLVVYGLDDTDPRRDIACLGWLYGFLLGEAIGGKRRPQRIHWQSHNMVKEPRSERARAILAACSIVAAIPKKGKDFIDLVNQYGLGGINQRSFNGPEAAAIALAQAGLAESRAANALKQWEQAEKIEAEIKLLESPLAKLRDALHESLTRIRSESELTITELNHCPPLGTLMGPTQEVYIENRMAAMADLLQLVPKRHPNGIHFFACQGDVPGKPFYICASVVLTNSDVKVVGTRLRLQLWCETYSSNRAKFNAYRLIPNGKFRNDETGTEADVAEISAMVSNWMIALDFWSPDHMPTPVPVV